MICYFTAPSLRAQRGNPVLKRARSATLHCWGACDSHWIATSPAVPRNEQNRNRLFFLRQVPGPKGLGSGLAMTMCCSLVFCRRSPLHPFLFVRSRILRSEWGALKKLPRCLTPDACCSPFTPVQQKPGTGSNNQGLIAANRIMTTPAPKRPWSRREYRKDKGHGWLAQGRSRRRHGA